MDRYPLYLSIISLYLLNFLSPFFPLIFCINFSMNYVYKYSFAFLYHNDYKVTFMKY